MSGDGGSGRDKQGPKGSAPAGQDGSRRRRRRRRKPAGFRVQEAEPKRPGHAQPLAQPLAPDSRTSTSSEDKTTPTRRRRTRKRQAHGKRGSGGPGGSGGNRENREHTSRKQRPDSPEPEAELANCRAVPREVPETTSRDASGPSRQTSPKAAVDPASLAPGDSPWGDDSAAPTPEVTLAPSLPPAVQASELDPSSLPPSGENGGYQGSLAARVANVVALRFVRAGRLYLYDGGDETFERGDMVMVEGDRGNRVATVASGSCRKPPPRTLKRVLRRAGADEQSSQQSEECEKHLGTAKKVAKKQGLTIKLFRAEFEGPNALLLYYACEQKTDVRALSRALNKSIPLRVDLRHTGARDEAKMVGGIGSCGQELCCTTWLPAFVPVSIRNAKEQGMVLNPTKVSGQCGRLKCCLVYEQALYSEMRKGLPKVGKRVVTQDGLEGRVIEVDVLHQKIRVAIGRGESRVYEKGEVEPMFASQPQGQAQKKKKRTRSPESDTSNGAPSSKETSNDKD